MFRDMHPQNYLIALITLVLCACAPQAISTGQRMEAELQALRAEKMKEIDVDACERQGGVVRGVCMLGLPACVLPYTDAGQVCTDSSECEGRCLLNEEGPGTEDRPLAGADAIGVCETDDNPCGCWSEIKEGAIQRRLCAD